VLIAQVYAGLGESERALDELERGNRMRALDMVWIRSRHTFDALRGEARFAALATRA
jgi:hypothetical protein